MYNRNMPFQVSILIKARISNKTFKWLLSLMNCCNVSFQVSTLSEDSITNETLE